MEEKEVKVKAPKKETAPKKEVVKVEVAPKAETPKVKKADNNGKLIKVTLIHGTNGCREKQIKTVQALGLTKVNSFKVVKDNDATRGMIAVVSHLVKAEEAK